MNSATVVIIGGGVIGLSTAYQLALKRVGRIVLLDKGALGDGASIRAAGIGTHLMWSEPGVRARQIGFGLSPITPPPMMTTVAEFIVNSLDDIRRVAKSPARKIQREILQFRGLGRYLHPQLGLRVVPRGKRFLGTKLLRDLNAIKTEMNASLIAVLRNRQVCRPS